MPKAWCLPSNNQWNNGMLEKWNNGHEKRMKVRFYFLFLTINLKMDLIPLTTIFQHSIIPALHCI